MQPIDVVPLFPEVSRRLVELLRSLTDYEWHQPTISSHRTVKDIASHLLDGSLRRLSFQRDAYRPLHSHPRSDESLLDFLNRLNAEWEEGTRRLSPAILVGLIEWADAQLADFFRSLDLNCPAVFPVAWAGELESKNWMDIARDYTEKWHHTQQIFEATARPSTITRPELFRPCLDIFMRALPHTFRTVGGQCGTIVTVVVVGESGGSWHIERGAGGWQQVVRASRAATATVTMNQDTAWKLVTKRRSRSTILDTFTDLRIEGDQELGLHVLDMVSVMA